MDLTQNPPQRKKRTAAWLIGIVLCLSLVGLIALFAIPTRNEPLLVWLTPAQTEQIKHPGMLTRIMQAAEDRFVTFRQRHLGSPTVKRTLLQFHVFEVSPHEHLTTLLGPPSATNADGRRAWLLSGSDYSLVKGDFRLEPWLTNAFSPAVLTADGQHAQMNMGTIVPTGPPVPVGTPGPAAPPTIFVGNSIYVFPQSLPGPERLVRLTVIVSSTDFGGFTGTNVNLKTNFFTASRTLVPSGGALIIECPNGDVSNPTNYLLIAAPEIPGQLRMTGTTPAPGSNSPPR